MMVRYHDTGYKELFSHPEFVTAMLDGFVPHEISRLLDHSTLKSHPGHYITPLLEERIEDAVWSLPFRPDTTIDNDRPQRLYLYILLGLVFNVENALAANALQQVTQQMVDAASNHPDKARIDRVLVRWFKRFYTRTKLPLIWMPSINFRRCRPCWPVV